MNRMLKGWRQTGRGAQFKAHLVNYADDFVILSRGKAEEALKWVGEVTGKLKLTLNEKKTVIRDARQEQFDFLGYQFGPHYSTKTGKKHMGCSPSAKSMRKIRRKVSEHLKPSNVAPWEQARDRLNQKLSGWKAYFQPGNPWKAFRVVDDHVQERVRHFLRRRHKVQSQGTREFTRENIFGELGVLRLTGRGRRAFVSLR